ncbi:baseplate J/gp47 family protein [Fusibacter ferrireducens]|uniref:Baseplate J/gp47 family protein n=1 Tax=Fusibacter ferrireducens TaxID=2785058 RepID=A0ABR9ZNJ3_9FIRM|nr:baseplate J/gp47 family protein [Fusibacter ferrireducens]MBF4692027.1 baseplate J/gp47 family protein [Fusibacter ferrireducens]
MNYFDLKNMTRTQLIETLKTLSKSYTPEWHFDVENPDLGTALALIYADMMTDTIKKAHQMPDKHYIDFLNLLDPVQKPSKGAKGYVTFSLSEGTKEGVSVPLGKQLIGESDAEENLIFETMDDLMIVPSKLENIIVVNPETDEITHHFNHLKSEDMAPLYLLDTPAPQNLQTHELVIRQDNALTLNHAHGIEIHIEDVQNKLRKAYTLSQLSDPEKVAWLYLKDQNWVPFDHYKQIESGILLKNNLLIELETPEIKLKMKRATEMICDEIKINPISDVLKPDALYYNEMELPEKDFMMFGTQFFAYDALYISSEELLTKKGSLITLSFEYILERHKTPFDVPPPNIKWKNVLKKSDLKEPVIKEIFISDIVLEYWNGVGWSKLETETFNRKMFATDDNEPIVQKIIFRCPDDLMSTTVGAYENYWIRLKIIKVENAYTTLGDYIAPKLRWLKLHYVYDEHGVLPSALKRYEFLTDQEIDPKSRPLRLFSDYGALNAKALYLQFDAPLIGAPIKLLFDVGTVTDLKSNRFKWQMLKRIANKAKWVDIDIIDDTNSLHETGVVTFIGDENHARSDLFGHRGYWLRLVQTEAGTLPVLLNAIYLNSVNVTQKETKQSQYFSLRHHEYHKEMVLNHENLESLEVWVNELNVDMEEIKKANCDYRQVLSVDGTPEALWVKWDAYESFSEMNATTRGYVANAFAGRIHFGDSVHGFLPDGINENNIRVDYEVNLGEYGNVAAYEIKRLAQTISNVNTVFNPIPFQGGHAPESRKRALNRISETIHHRGRARSTRDFDALILSADYDIKEVLTLSNTDTFGRFSLGKVTSIVLPKSETYMQDYFRTLKAKIKNHLNGKLPCTLKYDYNYFIIEPLYIIIDVQFKGKIADVTDYLGTYNAVEKAINRYLDTYKGNKNGEGWHIGDLPDEQYLLSQIQRIDTLKDINLLVLNAKVQDGYQLKEISINVLNQFPHLVIKNGNHAISLK